MRFLVHLYSYPPYRYVGGEMMTARLLEALVEHDHEVTVFAESIHKQYERHGVMIRNAAYLHRDVARDYDVFITHPEIRTNVWQYVDDMPYIAIVHNIRPHSMRQLDRATPTLTIANSEFTKAHLPANVHTGRMGVMVIHPPTSIEPVEGPHSAYGMVNISLEKGGQILNYVATKNPKLKFYAVMGGHGLQVESQPMNVKIVGQTPQMADQYAEMKCLLFPSHEETYGMVAAEAIICGVPVIASTHPAIHEACGDAGQYIDPYDSPAWNEAVRAMEDPKTYKHWADLTKERASFLVDRSKADLARWVALAEEAGQ